MEAIAYARISPRSQASLERNESIEEQLARMRSYADAVGLVITQEVRDELKSGTSWRKRPAFADAIEQVCTRRAVLLVYDLKRFARNTKEAIELVEKIETAGANLVSLSERIDTTTGMGRFIFRLFASLAELERDQISERTRAAIEYRISTNQLATRPDRLPWGKRLTVSMTCPRCREGCGTWTPDMGRAECDRCKYEGPAVKFRNKMVDCPEERAVANRAHDILASKGNLKHGELARELMRRGVKNPRTGLAVWDRQTVRGMLKRFPAPWEEGTSPIPSDGCRTQHV